MGVNGAACPPLTAEIAVDTSDNRDPIYWRTREVRSPAKRLIALWWSEVISGANDEVCGAICYTRRYSVSVMTSCVAPFATPVAIALA